METGGTKRVPQYLHRSSWSEDALRRLFIRRIYCFANTSGLEMKRRKNSVAGIFERFIRLFFLSTARKLFRLVREHIITFWSIKRILELSWRCLRNLSTYHLTSLGKNSKMKMEVYPFGHPVYQMLRMGALRQASRDKVYYTLFSLRLKEQVFV